jgi:PIN domain nuclease of toxin-antitoxin system
LRVLLDTHALLWAFLSPTQLSRSAAFAITKEENEIVVSAATAWEIATKVRIGKLPWAEELEREFLHHIATAGYVMAEITPEIALRAGRLPGDHRDPFDRIIAAHALAEDMPVISADLKLDAFGVRRLW